MVALFVLATAFAQTVPVTPGSSVSVPAPGTPFYVPGFVPKTIPGLVPAPPLVPGVPGTPGSIPAVLPGTAVPTPGNPAPGPIPAPNTPVNLVPGFVPAPGQVPALIPATIAPASGTAIITGNCGTCNLTGNTTNYNFGDTSYDVSRGCFSCINATARQVPAGAKLAPGFATNGLNNQEQCDDFFRTALCTNTDGAIAIRAIFGNQFSCFCAATQIARCPSCNTSKKGLLGLLGLLGLIPLCLLLLLCCLCFLRRKKRQQDVHFATFDPAAANLAIPASHIAPPPAFGAPGPCF